MQKVNIQYHKTKIGELILGSYEGKLCLLDYRFRKQRTTVDERIQKGLQAEYVEQDDDLLCQAREQVDEYLVGKRKTFDLPLLTIGTDFQKSVWEALLQIGYGETSTYLALSRKLGNEKAIRAVALANGANAIAIIIPCHRIIGSDGKLVGYAGGLSAKRHLLLLEKEISGIVEEGTIDFGEY